MNFILRRRLALACLLLPASACLSAYTGNTSAIVDQADRSDPVRAVLADALDALEENFAPLVTAPFDEAERAALVEQTLCYDVMNQGKSKMDLLRAAEAIADSARHVSCTLDGAEAYYWQQDVIISGATSHQQFVTWTYDVPFDQRLSVAADLEARVDPMFSGGTNWSTSRAHDKSVNPHFAQTIHSTFTDMNMNADSTMVQVSVMYAHDEKNHAALGGVMLRIMKMETKLD